MIIDRKGKVVDAHVGIVEKDAWEQEIQQLVSDDHPIGIVQRVKKWVGCDSRRVVG